MPSMSYGSNVSSVFEDFAMPFRSILPLHHSSVSLNPGRGGSCLFHSFQTLWDAVLGQFHTWLRLGVIPKVEASLS